MRSSLQCNRAAMSRLGLLPVATVIAFLGYTDTAEAQNNSISVSPISLDFCVATDTSPAPGQTLTLTSTDTNSIDFGVSALTYAGGSWLSVSPATGMVSSTTPASVSVSVNPANLAVGTYTGLVVVSQTASAASDFNIFVNLVVGKQLDQQLHDLFSGLSFTDYVGGTTPSQNFSVSGCGASGTVAATTNSSIFMVTPPTATISPTTLATFSVAVNPAGLTAGPYTGEVTVSAGSLGSLTVSLSLTAAVAGSPLVGAVVNSASESASGLFGSSQGGLGPGFVSGVSPGELVTIYGANIGPSTPQTLQLTSAGTVATTLSDTQVMFDNVAAPLIYVSSGQINAIAPYEIAGRATTNLVVNVNGSASPGLPLTVIPVTPAIFTSTQTGLGACACLNQDSSVNSASNPAAPGTVVVLYGTGGGVLSPQPATGSVTPSSGTSFPMPVDQFEATIGGLPAQILYVGSAPGEVLGVFQVNMQVPKGLTGGPRQPVGLVVHDPSGDYFAQGSFIPIQ
jgi:uncharacterized protein (TIGR03437 family)